jgi:hypothetical protein
MAEIVKVFGRFSVRKSLMQEPRGPHALGYGDLCFGVVWLGS